MDLTTTTLSARRVMDGVAELVMANPQSFKIQTLGPGAGELLNVQCPAGKQWELTVLVRITESDA